MPSNGEKVMDDVALAAMDMVRRTGAIGIEIRYSDDGKPVVWMGIAEYNVGRDRKPAPKHVNGRQVFVVGAGLTPRAAVVALLDEAIDGGMCAYCSRPTGVTEEWRGDMPFADAVCWYRYDPETKDFRRGCEGDV